MFGVNFRKGFRVSVRFWISCVGLQIGIRVRIYMLALWLGLGKS